MNEEQKKEFEQKLKDKKLWFCPLPFTHIFSSLSGRFAPCYDALARTGHNMEDTSIKEWYTSEYQNRLRKEMLKEDWDPKFFFTKIAITPRLKTNFIKIKTIYIVIISNFLSRF